MIDKVDDIKLSARYAAILHILIDEHIRTGAPVGSETISRLMNESISSATVRNIMRDLDEMGFLRQPHTSAGRVPTAKAFRYYVANMMNSHESRLTTKEKDKIARLFAREFSDIFHLLEDVGKILATISRELSLIVTPAGEEVVLHRIELIPLDERKLVMILVTDSGLTRSIIIEFPDMLGVRLELLKNNLNRRLSGLRFSEIRKTIAQRLADLEEIYGSSMTRLIKYAQEIFYMTDETTVIHGRENILDKPEFSNPEKLRQVMELCEDRDIFARCLPEKIHEDVEIIIGPPPAAHLGMVLASFMIGNGKGILGIVGPARMDYPRVAELVLFTTRKIAEFWR